MQLAGACSVDYLHSCVSPPQHPCIHTQLGVSLDVLSPPIPLVIFCGSKKKPSDLLVSVRWTGTWTHEIDSINMKLMIGTITYPIVSLQYTQQNHIELQVKLSSGYELRPVKFNVEITINTKNKISQSYIVKDTYCVLMTAPSTQRRKALSALAWQELGPRLETYKSPMKNSKIESVCTVAQLDTLLRGRWQQLFDSRHTGHHYPERFSQLLSSLTKNAFFHSLLISTRQTSDVMVTKLKEKEFRKIWSWYESVFGFIEEYAALFFKVHVPQIQGRKECEQSLKSNPQHRNTFTLRFASEENLVSLSVCKEKKGCSHMSIPFKEITFLAEYIQILEKNKFVFVDYNGHHCNSLSPLLRTLAMFSKQETKVVSGYLNPMASITEAISEHSSDVENLDAADIDSWTPDIVAEWFRKKDIAQYKTFQHHQICGAQLNANYLSHDRLASMGFGEASAIKIQREIMLLRQDDLAVSPVRVGEKRKQFPYAPEDQQKRMVNDVDSLIQMLLSPTPDETEQTKSCFAPSPVSPSSFFTSVDTSMDSSFIFGSPNAARTSAGLQLPSSSSSPSSTLLFPKIENQATHLFGGTNSLFTMPKQEPNSSLKDFLSKPPE